MTRAWDELHQPHQGAHECFGGDLDGVRQEHVFLVVNHASERHRWFDRRGEHTAGGAYGGPDAAQRERYVFVDPDDPESYHGWLGTRPLAVLDLASAALQRSVYAACDAGAGRPGASTAGAWT